MWMSLFDPDPVQEGRALFRYSIWETFARSDMPGARFRLEEGVRTSRPGPPLRIVRSRETPKGLAPGVWAVRSVGESSQQPGCWKGRPICLLRLVSDNGGDWQQVAIPFR